MSRRAATAAYAAVGALFLLGAVTGTGGQLVRPWFLPALGVAGLLIVACSTTAARQTTLVAGLVVLLPVAAWIGVAGQQPSLSGAALASSGDGGPQRRIGDKPNPLLSGRGGEVTVLQVATASSELGPAALTGRDVQVLGISDGHGAISRLAMVCCIADARRVTLHVDGSLPRAGQWVRVSGRLAVRDADVVLEPTSVTAVRRPDRPVL